MSDVVVGDCSPSRPATPEVERITNQVKSQFEENVHRKLDLFNAIIYRTQVVAGVFYYIKVQVTASEYVHLKVFLGLPPNDECPALVNFQLGKTKDDPLICF